MATLPIRQFGSIIFNVDGNKKVFLVERPTKKIKNGSLSNSVDEKISYNLI